MPRLSLAFCPATVCLTLWAGNVHAAPVEPAPSPATTPETTVPGAAVPVLRGEAVNPSDPPPTPHAAPGTPLQLDALLADLLARNPEIAARVALREAETARERRAWAFPDPVVQIMGENLPLGSSMTDTGEASHSALLPPMISYQVSQMVMFPGKRALMAREAAAGIDMARASLEITRQDLLAAGRKMYFDLYLNVQERRINLANQRLVDQFRQLALARYSAGLEAHHDVLRAQIEIQSFENALLTLDQQRQSMTAMLNAWRDQHMETPLGEPQAAFSAPRTLSQTDLEAQALKARPELQKMAAMVAQEDAMTAVARREYYPDIMVMGMYQQMIGDMDAWGAAVSFSVPLWLGKKQKLEVAEKQQKAQAARKSLEAMRAMVRFEVQDARLKVDTAERRIQLIDKTLIPKADEALSSLMASYRAGKTDFTSLLETRRTLQDLQLALEQARVEREQRLADLDRAVGTASERIGQ